MAELGGEPFPSVPCQMNSRSRQTATELQDSSSSSSQRHHARGCSPAMREKYIDNCRRREFRAKHKRVHPQVQLTMPIFSFTMARSGTGICLNSFSSATELSSLTQLLNLCIIFPLFQWISLTDFLRMPSLLLRKVARID